MSRNGFRIRCRICAAIILCALLSLIVPANGRADENAGAYTGFCGTYQKICINNKTVYQQGSKFVLTDSPITDKSDLFLPRDMGDGSFAFENKKTENRIAKAEQGEALPATLYNIHSYYTEHHDNFAGLNDNTQHWILERKDDTDTYYLKSLDNELYMGVSASGELTAVDGGQKAEISFKPVPDESPLYLLSLQPGYDTLPENQRAQIERVYESVAGDVFEPRSPYVIGEKETPRAAIDNLYNVRIKGQKVTAEQFHSIITSRFNKYSGFYNVIPHIGKGYNVSMNLPDTEDSSYKFYAAGEPYTDAFDGIQRITYMLKVYDKDDNNDTRTQTIRMYIQNNDIGIKNAKTFCEVMKCLPYALRHNINTVTSTDSSERQYTCDGTSIAIQYNKTPSVEEMTEGIVHELGHSIDWEYSSGSRWSMGAEWTKAMADDCYATSDYSHTNNKEDFAEFCRLYFACYTNRDWQRALMILFPNRYRLFKRVRMAVMDGYSLWDDGPEKNVTVCFDYNNGGATQPTNETAEQYSCYGEIMPEEPVWEDRTFLGWFTQAARGSKITDQQRIIDDNVTVYAHWSDPPGEFITIHFDPDNGGEEIVVKVRRNTRISQEIPDPVRSGYSFFGWCTTKGFSERFDPRSDIVLFDDDEVYLKAQWDALPNTSPNPTETPMPTATPTPTAAPTTTPSPTPSPTPTASGPTTSWSCSSTPSPATATA